MLRIAIIGPESTGKSTLTQTLAAHYQAVGVFEYARTYVEQLDRPYIQHDLIHIACQQMRELETTYPTELVFFDTDLIITKVWFEQKYGTYPAFITDYLTQHPVDFYLLCAPDLPFEPDPVRENPDRREELFAIYLNEIQQLNYPYAIVEGINDTRTQNAIQHLTQAFDLSSI